MILRNTYRFFLFFAIVCFIWTGCSRKSNHIPKPRGYFRIDFPVKEYQTYSSDCHYSFEYPVYAKIVNYTANDAEPCWINIEFPKMHGKIHITFKKISHNLATYSEDIRTFAYKHIIKADDIIEQPIINRSENVYGILYDIKGNTASSINFYLTDSTRNFLSGALYFNSIPNKDSLAPVIAFLREDIQHLIKTFEWH